MVTKWVNSLPAQPLLARKAFSLLCWSLAPKRYTSAIFKVCHREILESPGQKLLQDVKILAMEDDLLTRSIFPFEGWETLIL